jgi:lipopolysaccharide cholinephosphotransferase
MNNNELKLLHNKILEIAKYFDEFCIENDITYYLMGGTALGAIRHKGFIPWDDDYDVFMDYNNYIKLLRIVKHKVDKSKYYFQKEDTEEWPMFFSKLRMNQTTFIEKDVVGRAMHHGVYIDIMCLNNTSSNKYIRYIQYFCARALNTRAIGLKGYITNSYTKKIAIVVSQIFIRGVIKKYMLQFVRSFNSKETALVGHFFGRAPFQKTSFKRAYINQTRYVNFENLNLPVAYCAEEYLKIRYGVRYMDMPSDEEKMKYPSHAYIVDTLNDYNSYMT